MKVVIIDDEPLARELIREYLHEFPDLTVVAECGDGFDGVKTIQKYAPDLIFLDVRMPKLNGFEMLELLDELPFVIFTTAFDEYAMKAFEANAIDYLMKPFSQDRFAKAVNKFIDNKSSIDLKNALSEGRITENHAKESRIVVKAGNEIKIIPTEQICYIEAYDDYVKIHSDKKTFVKKKTMSYYENGLDGDKFVRIHRSFIVNIDKVSGLISLENEGHEIEMKDGVRLSVSRSGLARLKELLRT